MQVEDINKKSFSRMVETFVRTRKGATYIDAIVQLCEDNDLDVRDAKKLVTKQLIEHIEAEARDLNMLQGGKKEYTLF